MIHIACATNAAVTSDSDSLRKIMEFDEIWGEKCVFKNELRSNEEESKNGQVEARF